VSELVPIRNACNELVIAAENLEQRTSRNVVDLIDPCGSIAMETFMPIILWLLGVPLIVVIALMVTHVI
jgi:hypothetical protein